MTVDPDFKDNNGRTSLARAAWSGHEAVVRLAAGRGHEAVVKLLLDTKGVNPELKDDEYGRTPLSYAAAHGHEAVVRLLPANEESRARLESCCGQTRLSYQAAAHGLPPTKGVD
ncbi:ankyrin repeat-containing domain protein [Hypoxylon sp. FL0890]|nr:ankyrin repeat-containing domain protein [Hypoxylon sp. FL0890]